MTDLLDILNDCLSNVDFNHDWDIDNLLSFFHKAGVDLTQFTKSEICEALEEALRSNDIIESEQSTTIGNLMNNYDNEMLTGNNDNDELLQDTNSKPLRGQVNFRSSNLLGSSSNPLFSTCVNTQLNGSTVLTTNDPMTAMMNPHPSPEEAVIASTKANYQHFIDDAETPFNQQQRIIMRDDAAREVADVERFLQKANNKFHS